MNLEPIRYKTALALAHVKELIREAEATHDNGPDLQKVAAAGELVLLSLQRALLEARLREIDRREAAHDTAFAWFRQEWFNLMRYFESWIAHG
jgi:hypothetical protein